MRTLIFNFNKITNIDDFYKQFCHLFAIPRKSLNNLDSLWDQITGFIELPVKIEFINLSPMQLIQFKQLISLFKQAKSNTEGNVEFSYTLKPK